MHGMPAFLVPEVGRWTMELVREGMKPNLLEFMTNQNLLLSHPRLQIRLAGDCSTKAQAPHSTQKMGAS